MIDPTTWSATAVSYIIKHREYMGDTVLRKTTNDDFKNKKARRMTTEDELIIHENTHEPIVNRELSKQGSDPYRPSSFDLKWLMKRNWLSLISLPEKKHRIIMQLTV